MKRSTAKDPERDAKRQRHPSGPDDDVMEESKRLYDLLMKSEEEKLLPIDDIQGDPILGFNLEYNALVIFDLKDSKCPKMTACVKQWLLCTICPMITTTLKIRQHRDHFRRCSESTDNASMLNVSFGYNCLKVLLTDTAFHRTIDQFDSNSAFALGASRRALLLGDENDLENWEFGTDCNNDILVNIATRSLNQLNEMTDRIVKSCKAFLKEVNTTRSFRGRKGEALYGHEHFGFQDGLSQPEVRGKYENPDTKEIDFIVRRRVVASQSDCRYKNYSRPGFRLLDVGHVLLGHLEDFHDTLDTGMQNPNPSAYRTLLQKYPDWCNNATYVVYRKISQDVSGFWKYMKESAVKVSNDHKMQMNDNQLKDLAGDIAAKCVGRWWDGTPLSFGKPISGWRYPPTNCIKVPDVSDDEKNGFMFEARVEPWPVFDNKDRIQIIKPPESNQYDSDEYGLKCPFGAHMRKVNPRDEFTDIGSNVQALKHRIIRRSNNYFDFQGSFDPRKCAYDRVGDVFNPTEEELVHERGLAFVSYQANIEDQFEFLQRHWANSSTRPRHGGDDFVIGQSTKPHHSQDQLTIAELPSVDLGGKPLELVKTVKFTNSKGLGYFLLPTVSAIKNVICAPPPVCVPKRFYSTPAYTPDFKYQFTHELWEWTIESLYWRCIWNGTNATDPNTGMPQYSDDMTGAGIGYRLPQPPAVPQKTSYLQFRSTKDLHGLADEKHPLINEIVSWNAFPKRLLDLYAESSVNQYEAVEVLGWPSADVTYRKYPTTPKARQMDEYCEWFTHRNSDGKITRVDITCESPEYYQFLFAHEPQTVVELYRKYVSPLVNIDDLRAPDGSYDVYNDWNTTKGIMHLNCPPNSLFAEVYIAAEASTYWQKIGAARGEFAKTGADLIKSGQYGLPSRASDPTIGAYINRLIRKRPGSSSGLIVSVSDPVGLYLRDLDTSGWQKPQNRERKPFTNEEIGKIIQYERTGTKTIEGGGEEVQMNLRIKIEIPDDFGYTIGDCFLGDVPITWAGQLIDSSVTVFLVGVAVSGEGYVLPDADVKAVVPPKRDWDGKTIGPKLAFNPTVNPPEPPHESQDGSTKTVATTCQCTVKRTKQTMRH